MPEPNFMKVGDIQLGDVYKDVITGYTGVATSATGYLMSCVRVGLSPTKLDKTGLPEKETPVFDANQLIWVGKHKPLEAMERKAEGDKTGGPGRVNSLPAVPKR